MKKKLTFLLIFLVLALSIVLGELIANRTTFPISVNYQEKSQEVIFQLENGYSYTRFYVERDHIKQPYFDNTANFIAVPIKEFQIGETANVTLFCEGKSALQMQSCWADIDIIRRPDAIVVRVEEHPKYGSGDFYSLEYTVK